MKLYSYDDVLYELQKRIKQAGSQKAAARLLNISTSYLNDVLNDRRGIAGISHRLGFQQVLAFCKKSPAPQQQDGE